MIVHPLKNYQPIAGCLDAIAPDNEAVCFAKIVLRQLHLDQSFGAFLECLLHLSDAYDQHALIHGAGLYGETGEEMRLTGTSAAPCAFVACRLQQRMKYWRAADGEDARTFNVFFCSRHRYPRRPARAVVP